MTDKEIQSNINGARATLENLKAQCSTEARRVSKLHQEGVELAESLRLKEEASALKIQRGWDALNKEKDEFVDMRGVHQQETIKHLKNIKELKEEEHVLNKKLASLNMYILNGEKRLGELKNEEVQYIDAEKKKEGALGQLRAVEQEFSRCKEAYLKFQEVVSAQHLLYEADLAARKAELGAIEERTKQSVTECTLAENRKLKFDNEYDRKVIDLGIYEERVRKKYEFEFPGKRMKLK